MLPGPLGLHGLWPLLHSAMLMVPLSDAVAALRACSIGQGTDLELWPVCRTSVCIDRSHVSCAERRGSTCRCCVLLCYKACRKEGAASTKPSLVLRAAAAGHCSNFL